MTCQHTGVYWISMKHAWCDDCETVFVHASKDQTSQVTTLDLDLKVDIFESRQVAWFFEPLMDTLQARRRVFSGGPEISVGEYVALNTLLTYFEAMEHYRHPAKEGNRTRFERAGARILAGYAPPGLEVELWKKVRNQMFHQGMTYQPVNLHGNSDETRAAWMIAGRLHVNVHALLRAVRADFDAYVGLLRDTTQTALRRDFVATWDKNWANS